VWEVATGRLLRAFSGNNSESPPPLLAFSPDGRLLAATSPDTTVNVFDLSGRKGHPARLDEAGLGGCWGRLASPGPAEDAVWDMACSPDGPAFLAKRLRPQLPVPEAKMRAILMGLDSDEFEDRARAEAELAAHGPGAVENIRRALASRPSLDVTARLRRVLAGLPAAVDMQTARAVAALEYSGSPQAWAALKRLSAGAKGAPLTEAAGAALSRIDRARR
jgi:hypothetical protein